MAGKTKDEFPPLLGAGLHVMSAQDIKVLAVDDFPHSQRRGPLWQNLMELVDLIRTAGFTCKIWIDGSFLTKKIDPDDIDLVVDFRADEVDTANLAQQHFFHQLSKQQFRNTKNLHTYCMIDAPLGHNLYPLSVAAVVVHGSVYQVSLPPSPRPRH